MHHAVLLGDSIFDNGVYVGASAELHGQVRRLLPAAWRTSLLARDGSVLADMAAQFERLPADASHLLISCGGNDVLGLLGLLHAPVRTILDAFTQLAAARTIFEAEYQAMLAQAIATGKCVAVCTIYDSVPGLSSGVRAALCLFNDAILRGAIAAGVAVIDLRLVCTSPVDYAPSSPIEPSAIGGEKIAQVIASLLTEHDVDRAHSMMYAGNEAASS